MNNQIIVDAEAKREWARPELRMIEAGSAESGDAVTPDSGGPGQTS